MGKNSGNSWLNAVKKAFRSPVTDDHKRSSSRRREVVNVPQEEDHQKKRGKKRWIFGRHFPLETTIQHNIGKCSDSSAVSICSGDENLVRKQPKIDKSDKRRAVAAAVATTEATVATAQSAAAEIIRLTRPARSVKQHKAALLIQTTFRAYLARRALLALKGVVKLQALIRGHNVRKRAKMTLQCIQSLVRVQALVCDQRRRLSFDSAAFSQQKSGTKSAWRNAGTATTALEEIQSLIEKANECSLRQGRTLARALSQQIWTSEEDRFSDKYTPEDPFSDRKTIHQRQRKDGSLCSQPDPIKTVEVDTSGPYIVPSPRRRSLCVQSPKTPPSATKSICSSPYYQTEERRYRTAETPTLRAMFLHRMSMSEISSCPLALPRPNYMAATASAMARVTPPRVRPSSPSPSRRSQMVSAKKRLSFPVYDEHKLYYGTE